MDSQEAGGLTGILAAVGGIVALFRAREARLAKKLDVEQVGQQEILDRLAALELHSDSRAQQISQLSNELATTRQALAKATWELEDLRRDYEELLQQHETTIQQIDDLKSQLIRLYSERVGSRPKVLK